MSADAPMALDLARSTGWTCGAAGSVPAVGEVLFSSRERPAVMAALMDWLDDARAVHGFTRIVAEAPMVTGDFRGRDAALMAIEMHGFVSYWCWENAIPFRQEHVGTVRKAVLGRGNFARGAAKLAVISWCEREGIPIGGHDAADAALLWAYATGYRRQREMAA